MKNWIGALITMLLGACMLPRPTLDTLPTIQYPSISGQKTDTLLIMLPGIQDNMHDFATQGLVSLVNTHQPQWDMVAVDAHFGYYKERSIIARLSEDVIKPAQANGYSHIWLTGPSLGGFGSLLYACRDNASIIDGVITIAPYLGESDILKDIESAGGAEKWKAADAGEIIERELWTCLRDGIRPQIWLGWGTKDRLRRGNRLLADLLPSDHVFNTPGGHRWSVWLQLWEQVLPALDGGK